MRKPVRHLGAKKLERVKSNKDKNLQVGGQEVQKEDTGSRNDVRDDGRIGVGKGRGRGKG